ncbi:hypothetical protein [Azospirillum sp. Sh1]|uniref:hypothetical protein n=1 Tax=Azospirillum sp. Sh1 TaxID=2607285 RepID=UPI0011EDE61C|nr:hypothetical protein [Azospirillum sp. Sh1]KAA0578708.1 hypothetical protein FZ029_09020 [Azospirillum sp. Sh1]
MSSLATLSVLKHGPKTTGIKAFVDSAKNAGAEPFYTYVSLNGDRSVKFVYSPVEGHAKLLNQTATLEAKHGTETAVGLASAAAKEVEALAIQHLHVVARSHKNEKPSTYVQVWGVKVSDSGQFLEALGEIAKATGDKVRYAVLRPSDSGGHGKWLILIGFENLSDLDADGNLNQAHLVNAVGQEEAVRIGKLLAGSVEGYLKHTLQLLPHVSHF